LGIIRKIDLWNKSDTYEINNKKHHHEHMKCTKCGKIINFDSERICSILFKQAKKMGFNIQTHNIWILGICKNCN
jgi:Fur family ferric uptake transcriptional regulator